VGPWGGKVIVLRRKNHVEVTYRGGFKKAMEKARGGRGNFIRRLGGERGPKPIGGLRGEIKYRPMNRSKTLFQRGRSGEGREERDTLRKKG